MIRIDRVAGCSESVKRTRYKSNGNHVSFSRFKPILKNFNFVASCSGNYMKVITCACVCGKKFPHNPATTRYPLQQTFEQYVLNTPQGRCPETRGSKSSKEVW